MRFANPIGTGRVLDVCLSFGCGGVHGECVGCLDQGLEGWWCYVCVSSEFGFFVCCAKRIPTHLRCTQCSILLHLIDIGFLPYMCLWQISKIQTCWCVVVGPGFVSTSPVFYEKHCETSNGSA